MSPEMFIASAPERLFKTHQTRGQFNQQLFCRPFSCAKKLQTQTVTTEKLLKTIS